MTLDPILVEQDGRVVTVTFNRPEARNAMTFEMYETLHDLCDKIDKDAGVRVMVLTGAGDKAFVSGTDIRQFLTFKTKDDALGYEARITRVLGRIANMTKPTIAMVGGDAVGGGMFMSLACDLRIVAEHARFGAPVARTLGNFAAPFSLGLLAATVGPVRAREIVLTARLVSAADAKTIGLVDEVHPAAALRGRVKELAAHIAELAPLTLAATKEAVRRMIVATSPGSLEDLLLSCYLSEDFKEGALAFEVAHGQSPALRGLPPAGRLAEAFDRRERAGHLQRALGRAARTLGDVRHRALAQGETCHHRRRQRNPRQPAAATHFLEGIDHEAARERYVVPDFSRRSAHCHVSLMDAKVSRSTPRWRTR